LKGRYRNGRMNEWRDCSSASFANIYQ